MSLSSTLITAGRFLKPQTIKLFSSLFWIEHIRAYKQDITLNIHSSFHSFVHGPLCALQVWVNATAVWLPGTKALSGFVHEAAHRSPHKQRTAGLCLRGSAASREVVFRPRKAVRASPAPRDIGTFFVPRKLFVWAWELLK